jgi:hypothetical protein
MLRRTGKRYFLYFVLGGEEPAKSFLVKVCLYYQRPTGERIHLVVAKIQVTINEDSTFSVEFSIVEPKFAREGIVVKEVLERGTEHGLGTALTEVIITTPMI